MFDYFYAGGPLFMSLISIAGLVALFFIIKTTSKVMQGKTISQAELRNIPVAGSTAFILGILGQVIGLYQAMSAIQQAGDVSPALLAGGFQVSMIAPIYGMILFVISLIAYLAINSWYGSAD